MPCKKRAPGIVYINVLSALVDDIDVLGVVFFLNIAVSFLRIHFRGQVISQDN